MPRNSKCRYHHNCKRYCSIYRSEKSILDQAADDGGNNGRQDDDPNQLRGRISVS